MKPTAYRQDLAIKAKLLKNKMQYSRKATEYRQRLRQQQSMEKGAQPKTKRFWVP